MQKGTVAKSDLSKMALQMVNETSPEISERYKDELQSVCMCRAMQI